MKGQIRKLRDKKIFLQSSIFKDPKAFAELYDGYVEKVYRFVLFKVSSVEEAEDITSQVFLKVWQYLQKEGNIVKNCNALIYKIAKNLVIDHYRGKGKKDLFIKEESLQKIPDHKDLSKTVEIHSDTEFLIDCLDELKDEYREVIVLKYINELSTKEIAAVLEKSRSATRVLLHRALNALKRVVEEKEK